MGGGGWGGGMRSFSGGARFAGSGIRSGNFVGSRNFAVNRGFVGSRKFSGHRFIGNRHFAGRRFHRSFAAVPFFVGGAYAYDNYYDDGCLAVQYTQWGPTYVNVCGYDYGY
jgi:hypothetical protein